MGWTVQHARGKRDTTSYSETSMQGMRKGVVNLNDSGGFEVIGADGRMF